MSSVTSVPADALKTSNDAEYYSPVSRAQMTKALKSGGKEEELRKASAEFASLFVNQMLSVMSESVDKSEFGHGGKGEEFFQGMLFQEYSRKIAYSDDFGLTQSVYEALRKKDRAAGGAGQDAEAAAKELAVKAQKMAHASQAARAYSIAGGAVIPNR